MNFVEAERHGELERLNALADEEIRPVVRRQIETGLDVVSDGEMRRAPFENSLYEGIEGVSPYRRKPDFTDPSRDAAEPPSTPIVSGRVRKIASPAACEAAILRLLIDRRSAAALAELGEDLDSLLAKAIAADAAVTEGIPTTSRSGCTSVAANYRSRGSWRARSTPSPNGC